MFFALLRFPSSSVLQFTTPVGVCFSFVCFFPLFFLWSGFFLVKSIDFWEVVSWSGNNYWVLYFISYYIVVIILSIIYSLLIFNIFLNKSNQRYIFKLKFSIYEEYILLFNIWRKGSWQSMTFIRLHSSICTFPNAPTVTRLDNNCWFFSDLLCLNIHLLLFLLFLLCALSFGDHSFPLPCPLQLLFVITANQCAANQLHVINW